MLTFLLKSKDVLYQVSNYLGEVSSFYNSYSDAAQKVPLYFKSSNKPAWYNKYPEEKAHCGNGHLCFDGQLVIGNSCKKPFHSA